MPRLLVVDDSPIDRKLVSGLLSHNPHFQVETATNATEAIAAVAKSPPDLVLTDMVMPDMNGLDLVARLKKSHPHVPIVLMTSLGTEDIAVRALRAGAASYVSKKSLAQELIPTIQTVLAHYGEQRNQELLFGHMARNECAFELSNDCALIPPLVGYLVEGLANLGLCEESERKRVGIALEEALANALYHGNLEIESELISTDYTEYRRLVEERLVMKPYCDRKLYVTARMSRSEVVFVIRDEGPGFSPKDLPDPEKAGYFDRTSGRGVLLMRTFMDDVVYNDKGNQVTLIKRAELDRGTLIVD